MIVNIFQLVIAEVEQRRLDDDWLQTLGLAIGFTNSAAFFLLPQNRLLKGSSPKYDDDHKGHAKSLMLSLQIYLDYYSVIRDTSPEIAYSVTKSIENLLEEIITTVPQLVRFDKTMDYVRSVDQGIIPSTARFFIHPADSTLIFSCFSSIILRDLFFPTDQAEKVTDETIIAADQIRCLAMAIIAREGQGVSFNPWPAISSLFLAEFALTVCRRPSGEIPQYIVSSSQMVYFEN